MVNEHLSFFKKNLEKDQIIDDSQELKAWGTDWTKEYTADPLAVVFPKSTEDVVRILSYCSKNLLPVVTSGGRTGLAGGAVACNKELVLSTSKLNQCCEVDAVGLSMSLDAGVITEVAQIKAKKHGLFFPIDLAAKGSSCIGGNIATNAGGLKFIRYGGMRDQVLGLEVVLASGEVLDLNKSLRKDNTGYDLKQLFIGSEGTLGVITKATLKLVQPPKELVLTCIGVKDFETLLLLLKMIHKSCYTLSAFEFFCKSSHDIVLENNTKIHTPFEKKYPYYALIELEGDNASKNMEDFLETVWNKGVVEDARIASSVEESRYLWSLREMISESLTVRRHVRKNDISIPITNILDFLKDSKKVIKDLSEDLEIVFFGHLGDGNIHINYLCPISVPKDLFTRKVNLLEKKIFERVALYRGSISAEHGIGLLKKEDLCFVKSAREIELMKSLKSIFDPLNIMNPGKIFNK